MIFPGFWTEKAYGKPWTPPSKCPLCGCEATYVGATALDCPNWMCKNYPRQNPVDPPDEETNEIEPIDEIDLPATGPITVYATGGIVKKSVIDRISAGLRNVKR